MIMGAYDLGALACIEGDYCRCIFMLYYVHDYHGVIAFDPCQLVTLLSSCM